MDTLALPLLFISTIVYFINPRYISNNYIKVHKKVI